MCNLYGNNVVVKLYLVLVVILATSSCYPTAISQNGSAHNPLTKQKIETRFMLGAWTLPHEEDRNPFRETLKGFIISNERQLEEFLGGLRLFQLRGTVENLAKTDFDRTLIVATYYMWRPLKGTPLSIESLSVKDKEVEVTVRLDEEAIGKERPFLMAPLEVVAIASKQLAKNVPIKFTFKLNGKIVATMYHTQKGVEIP